MTRRLIRATSTACLLLIGTTAMAQQPSNRHFSTEQQGRTDANSQASTSELEGISDEQHFIRYLTGKLALMNHGAIEMSN
ncbi:MAG: hypothetical protein KDA52_12495, partial [Planctomycetaceae bacterium]|nr:hypothetical protein [Planctomycetaceae bacterium]